MLICLAIGDTDPIRYRNPSPGGHFSGHILSEAMRPDHADPRHRFHAATDVTCSMLRVDISIKLTDLLLQRCELIKNGLQGLLHRGRTRVPVALV
jgi:hypothetical protein